MKKQSKAEFDFAAGEILPFDKPKEWTSFGVVKKIRGAVKVKKVGHAGTLDPLASGLLILCTGKMTKQIEGIQAGEKEYVVEFTLGARTPSYDLETEPEPVADPSHLTKADLEAAAQAFTGQIEQYPPAHSAVKIGGQRAYHKARAGEEVALRLRRVQITRFDILLVDLPKVVARIECGKGTYIRSLANDFGEKLGVGAHLSELQRTRIGDYRLEDAYSIEEFLTLIGQ